MRIYAETSAVLRWLLGGPDGVKVYDALTGAEAVVASRLTSVETRRTLVRAVATGELAEDLAGRALAALGAAEVHWTTILLSEGILARAAERFPSEPVRTLDAIHLATAVALLPEIGPLTVLSTDARIRQNAPLLGLGVLP